MALADDALVARKLLADGLLSTDEEEEHYGGCRDYSTDCRKLCLPVRRYIGDIDIKKEYDDGAEGEKSRKASEGKRWKDTSRDQGQVRDVDQGNGRRIMLNARQD